MSEKNATLGERIRMRRRALNLSQQDVANKTGVTVSSVSLWEQDKTRPVSNKLEQLSATLLCSPGWLISGEQNVEIRESDPPQSAGAEMAQLEAILELLPPAQQRDVVEFARQKLDEYAQSISIKLDKISALKNG